MGFNSAFKGLIQTCVKFWARSETRNSQNEIWALSFVADSSIAFILWTSKMFRHTGLKYVKTTEYNTKSWRVIVLTLNK